MKFEYVASGMAYSKLVISDSIQWKSLTEEVNRLCNLVRDRTSVDVSYLYNGFTESAFPNSLAHYRDSFDGVHADSGGLQVITQGKSIDDEMRQKIYQAQAHKDTTVAMCFDKIPIVAVGGKSSRNDTINRFFDKANADDCARQTAGYITEQAKVFEKLNSNTKIYGILQGNDTDSYKRWADVLFSALPSDVLKRVTGYAIGFGCLGSEEREAFQASTLPYYLKDEIPDSVTSFHLLGLGSVKRALPYLLAARKGLIPLDQMSFDSTSHTSGFSLGSFFTKIDREPFFTTLKIGRLQKTSYIQVLNRLKENLNVYYKDDEKTLDALFLSRPDFISKYNDPIFYHTLCIQCIFSSILDFCLFFSKCYTNEEFFKNMCQSSKQAKFLMPLLNTTSDYEFFNVLDELSPYMKSNRVRTLENMSTNTLDDFF